MNLQSMDVATLLRHAYAAQDDLTTSDLERELLRRLEKSERELALVNEFLCLVEDYEITAEDIRSVVEAHPAPAREQALLMKVLHDQDIHTTDQLIDLFDLAKQFRSLAQDAGDIFTRLSALTQTLQEK